MAQRVANPYPPEFKLNSDGLTYNANPDYLAFAGLKNDRQRAEFLARRNLGLPPAPKLPALSLVYPTRKSHVLDPLRYARMLSDNGRVMVDLAYQRALDETLDDSVRQGWWDRFWRACRYPNAAPVTETGEPVPAQEVNVLAFIGSDPKALAAAIALQRVLEAGTGERGGQVVEGVVVESTTPGLSERQDS